MYWISVIRRRVHAANSRQSSEGDVLGGAIAGFVAQGLDPFEAACLGLYVSSWAGELVRQELGSTGMLAGDVMQSLPRAIKDLRGEGARTPQAPMRDDILSMLTGGGAMTTAE